MLLLGDDGRRIVAIRYGGHDLAMRANTVGSIDCWRENVDHEIVHVLDQVIIRQASQCPVKFQITGVEYSDCGFTASAQLFVFLMNCLQCADVFVGSAVDNSTDNADFDHLAQLDQFVRVGVGNNQAVDERVENLLVG